MLLTLLRRLFPPHDAMSASWLIQVWHRVWCLPMERNTIRETVDGVLGYRCGCGHWAAVVTRHPDDLMAAVPRPAHERYRVTRRRLRLAERLKRRA